MTPRLANSKTLRFVEILALLIVVYEIFDSLAAPNLFFTTISLAGLTTLVLAGLGLRFVRARRFSWLALLLTGLLFTGLQPQSVEGPLLCLLSAFLLFDSGWYARRAVLMASLVATSILGTQVVALLGVADFSWLAIVCFLVTNGLFAVLIVMFRKDLFSVPERELQPTLNLDDFGLTNREIQILHLFWAGLSSKEIAGDLNLSDGRVRNHLTLIYRKVGVADGKELRTLIHSHEVVVSESGKDNNLGPRVKRKPGQTP